MASARLAEKRIFLVARAGWKVGRWGVRLPAGHFSLSDLAFTSARTRGHDGEGRRARPSGIIRRADRPAPARARIQPSGGQGGEALEGLGILPGQPFAGKCKQDGL